MQELVGKVIVFTKNIEDFENYAEANMRARIVRIDEETNLSRPLEDQLFVITVDYSEFNDYNRQFESANYYDKSGKPNLTAREANMYSVKEEFHFGSPQLWPFENYFIVADDHQARLLERFKASGAKNYVAWLESQISL